MKVILVFRLDEGTNKRKDNNRNSQNFVFKSKLQVKHGGQQSTEFENANWDLDSFTIFIHFTLWFTYDRLEGKRHRHMVAKESHSVCVV